MGKGKILEILKNEDGDYVGEYRVELEKDTRRAKMIVDALNAQITAIDGQILTLEDEITELEHQQDLATKQINHLVWLADCIKYGFGDERAYDVSDPTAPTIPPIEGLADTKIPLIPTRVITKPRKPGEVKPDYTDDFTVIIQNDKLIFEEIHRDPVDGQITPEMLSEVTITSDRRIVDLLTPVNDSPDRDIIATTTKSSDEQYPTQVVAVDVSDKSNPLPGNPLTGLPGIMEAHMAYEPVTNTPLVITMMVGGEAG